MKKNLEYYKSIFKDLNRFEYIEWDTKFKNKSLRNDIIIPIHNNDCKNFYKKQTFKILKNNWLI